MENDLSRSVSMQCSTCGGSEFANDERANSIRCSGCGRVYAREELIQENGGRIDAEVDAIKTALIDEIRKDFSKIIKK